MDNTPDNPEITTSFGSMRPWETKDAESLVKYANNRNIWLNLRDAFPHPYTIEDAHNYISLACNQDPISIFALISANEAVGSIGLMINSDVHRFSAELGYWLAEPFWGKGIMTEAVQKLVQYAFSRLSLIRIYAEPYSFNKSSCRVLEKCGFQLEGVLRCNVVKNGVVLDQNLYAIIKQPA